MTLLDDVSSISKERDLMRHVPPPEVVVRRLEEYRRHVHLVFAAIGELGVAPDEELVDRIAHRCEAMLRWIDRMTELARKRPPGAFTEGNWSERIEASLLRTVETLRSVDEATFRTRPPENSFDRSCGELIIAAFLAFRYTVEQLTADVAEYDAELFSKIFVGEFAYQPAEPQRMGPMSIRR